MKGAEEYFIIPKKLSGILVNGPSIPIFELCRYKIYVTISSSTTRNFNNDDTNSLSYSQSTFNTNSSLTTSSIIREGEDDCWTSAKSVSLTSTSLIKGLYEAVWDDEDDDNCEEQQYWVLLSDEDHRYTCQIHLMLPEATEALIIGSCEINTAKLVSQAHNQSMLKLPLSGTKTVLIPPPPEASAAETNIRGARHISSYSANNNNSSRNTPPRISSGGGGGVIQNLSPKRLITGRTSKRSSNINNMKQKQSLNNTFGLKDGAVLKLRVKCLGDDDNNRGGVTRLVAMTTTTTGSSFTTTSQAANSFDFNSSVKSQRYLKHLSSLSKKVTANQEDNSEILTARLRTSLALGDDDNDGGVRQNKNENSSSSSSSPGRIRGIFDLLLDLQPCASSSSCSPCGGDEMDMNRQQSKK